MLQFSNLKDYIILYFKNNTHLTYLCVYKIPRYTIKNINSFGIFIIEKFVLEYFYKNIMCNLISINSILFYFSIQAIIIYSIY